MHRKHRFRVRSRKCLNDLHGAKEIGPQKLVLLCHKLNRFHSSRSSAQAVLRLRIGLEWPVGVVTRTAAPWRTLI